MIQSIVAPMKTIEVKYKDLVQKVHKHYKPTSSAIA